MRALDIIRSEHRNMWMVTNGLAVLSQRITDQFEDSDLHTILLIVEYLEQFTERFHHPKEEEYLFARLRLRSLEANAVLDKLRHEHDMSPLQLVRIRELATAATQGSHRLKDLANEIASFREHLGAHMELEEKGTFELARNVLTPDDWREVDAAFAAHLDPMDDRGDDSRIARLRQRITQLLPAPEGLGAQVDIAPGHPSSPTSALSADLLITIRELRTRYGRIEVLHGVSIDVREGQLVALVGANGAGKTTLMRCISGIQPVSAGSIALRGQPITDLRPAARVRAGICQTPEGRQVFGPMTIEDNLLMGAYTRPIGGIADSLDETYDLFPILREMRKRLAGTLSGGQQQMLALARALMGKPKLLLLDEPSMGLAPLIVAEVFRIIRSLKDKGITILLVEQNARAALSIADHAYVMETGNVTLQGPGPELLANDSVRRAYLGM